MFLRQSCGQPRVPHDRAARHGAVTRQQPYAWRWPCRRGTRVSPRWWIPERRGTGPRWAVLLRWGRCPFSIGDGPPPREKVHSIANSSIAESPCSADELTSRREDLRADVAEVACAQQQRRWLVVEDRVRTLEPSLHHGRGVRSAMSRAARWAMRSRSTSVSLLMARVPSAHSYGPGFLDLPEIRGHEKSDLDLPALESQFGTQYRRSRSSASHLAPEPTAAQQL